MPDLMDSLTDASRMALHAPAAANRATADAGNGFWGEDGFTFEDILDVIIPLQHLPIISTLYRNMTGEDISPGARIFGGGLFGGVAGIFAAVFNTVVEDATGSDFGEHVMALFDDAPTPAVVPGQVPGTGQREWTVAGAARVDQDTAGMQFAGAATQPPRIGSNDLDTANIIAWHDNAHRAEQNIAATATHEPAMASPGFPEQAGDETPDAALWLTAVPVAKGDYVALSVERLTPATVEVLLKAVGHQASDVDLGLRQAMGRYEHSARAEEPRNIVVDNLI